MKIALLLAVWLIPAGLMAAEDTAMLANTLTMLRVVIAAAFAVCLAAATGWRGQCVLTPGGPLTARVVNCSEGGAKLDGHFVGVTTGQRLRLAIAGLAAEPSAVVLSADQSRCHLKFDPEYATHTRFVEAFRETTASLRPVGAAAPG